MKQTIFILFFLLEGFTVIAQGGDSSKTQPETFATQFGDSSYVMQKYFVVFLKTGPNRDQSEGEEKEIQQKHLAHLEKLYQDGKTSITGPFGDDDEIKGIVVFNTPTIEEARMLADQDPAVKTGRLIVEVHPWWAAKGSYLK